MMRKETRIVPAIVAIATILSISVSPQPRIAHAASNVPEPQGLAGVSDERGMPALDQVFRELRSPFTLMAVAARPRDLDEGALAYFRKSLGCRVVVVVVTRGEGTESPNRPELDQDLGVIRTRETIQLARVIGADVEFLNLRDFGYSKSPEEALAVWGHDEALRRLVRVIRSVRPDVIVTRHRDDSGDGIGRAASRLMTEAFESSATAPPAADALEPFQPSRLFQKIDWTEGRISQDIVSLDLNRYDRVRGLTYAEIGLRAHQQLRSYGANLDGLTPERQQAYYQLKASTPGDVISKGEIIPTSPFDGLRIPEKVARSIAPPWDADRTVQEILSKPAETLEALKEKLIEKRVEGSATEIHARYGLDFVRVIRFTETLERAIALLIGLGIEVTVSDQIVVGGQRLVARLVLENRSASSFPVLFRMPATLAVDDQKQINSGPTDALPGLTTREQTYLVPEKMSLTLPHGDYLREEEYYAIGSALPGAQPNEPFGERLIASVEVGLGQVNIVLSALARFDVAPPVEVSAIPFAMVRSWSTPRDLTCEVKLRNNTSGPLDGALWIVPIAVSDDNYEPLHIAFSREDQEVRVTLKLRLPILKPPLSPDVLLEFRTEKPDRPRVHSKARSTAPVTDLLGSTKIKVKAIDAQVAKAARVGFVTAIDSWLAMVLDELGAQNEEINPASLSRTVHGNGANPSQSIESCGDLSAYTAIVVDEDAYLDRPELLENNRCLLRYVRLGGTLVVLHQRPDDFRLLLPGTQLLPYPIRFSMRRVTRENVSVQIVDPHDRVLLRPNRITFKDFEGWSGELASDLADRWSEDYTAPLQSGDSGEDRERGLLLSARYGEGMFIYTSLALRRQLLGMNTGALRLLANLISASSADQPSR
jgi:LmbE family N-acetylglucosaminyl deacetylase